MPSLELHHLHLLPSSVTTVSVTSCSYSVPSVLCTCCTCWDTVRFLPCRDPFCTPHKTFHTMQFVPLEYKNAVFPMNSNIIPTCLNKLFIFNTAISRNLEFCLFFPPMFPTKNVYFYHFNWILLRTVSFISPFTNFIAKYLSHFCCTRTGKLLMSSSYVCTTTTLNKT